MSKLFENEFGMYISHEILINNVYKSLSNDSLQFCLNPDLVKIFKPYKTSKKKLNLLKRNTDEGNKNLSNEQDEVKLTFYKFIQSESVFNLFHNKTNYSNNKIALDAADSVKKTLESESGLLELVGGNDGPAVIKTINESKFLFPENCKFFSKDVFEMEKHLQNKKFDFILLDPPWWNKYIRRKRKVSSDAYNMMYNHDFKNLPIKELLAEDGLVAVWCTNSEQNVNALLTEIFPHWGVNFTSKWYWVKVTIEGEPICNFSKPPGKQPYEQLIFGHRSRSLSLPGNGKVLVSVPSAIHSHKPPLMDVLKEFLPKNPECLEVFARYLLPGWTSYGNEVLKLQHECLFT